MTIKLINGKITIEAQDLQCTLDELQAHPNDAAMSLPSVTAKSLCHDENSTSYSIETLTLLRAGPEEFLIEATVLVRPVEEDSDPKVDESYTNKPAIITVYRRVRQR